MKTKRNFVKDLVACFMVSILNRSMVAYAMSND